MGPGVEGFVRVTQEEGERRVAQTRKLNDIVQRGRAAGGAGPVDSVDGDLRSREFIVREHEGFAAADVGPCGRGRNCNTGRNGILDQGNLVRPDVADRVRVAEIERESALAKAAELRYFAQRGRAAHGVCPLTVVDGNLRCSLVVVGEGDCHRTVDGGVCRRARDGDCRCRLVDVIDFAVEVSVPSARPAQRIAGIVRDGVVVDQIKLERAASGSGIRGNRVLGCADRCHSC